MHIPTKKKAEMIKGFRKINSESQLTSGKKLLSKKSFLLWRYKTFSLKALI